MGRGYRGASLLREHTVESILWHDGHLPAWYFPAEPLTERRSALLTPLQAAADVPQPPQFEQGG